MRNAKRWLAGLAAVLGLSSTGCQTWMGGMTLPSPHYLWHYPQYIAPDPAFPLPRELATQTDPEGLARGGVVPGGPGGALVPPAPPAPALGALPAPALGAPPAIGVPGVPGR